MLTAVAAVAAGAAPAAVVAVAEEAAVEAAPRRNQRFSKHQRCFRQRPSQHQCRRVQIT